MTWNFDENSIQDCYFKTIDVNGFLQYNDIAMKETLYYSYDAPFTEELTLSTFLIRGYGYSSRLLTRIKTQGKVLINGRDCWLSSKVAYGDLVEVFLPEENLDMLPVEMPLDIIYEDEEVLVINKDAGTVTHPTKRHQEDTLGNYAAAWLKAHHRPTKIRFINRLDMDTSGVVVIAKNKYVHHYVQSGFAGTAQKEYLAFVHGVPKKREGSIDFPIKRISPDSIERIVASDGKPCLTHYRVIETYEDMASLLRLRLETGRTHQIRVHLKYFGYPIIGDPMYGNPDLPSYGMTRQALHAAELILFLPKSGKRHFRAGFKKDMENLWKELDY